jgi:hypothetical protein
MHEPTAEQTNLYASLFRGRPDVFARFWEKMIARAIVLHIRLIGMSFLRTSKRADPSKHSRTRSSSHYRMKYSNSTYSARLRLGYTRFSKTILHIFLPLILMASTGLKMRKNILRNAYELSYLHILNVQNQAMAGTYGYFSKNSILVGKADASDLRLFVVRSGFQCSTRR